MINLVVVSAEETLLRQAKTLAGSSGGSMTLVMEFLKSADGITPDELDHILAADPRIVFLDLGESMVGLRVIEALSQEAPGVTTVVAGPPLGADELLGVFRAGASEYLPRPFDRDDVAAAMQRVVRRVGRPLAAVEQEFGTVTTVFSPKGGTGVTTVAVNLAFALKQETGKKVLVLDLSPSLGTAALAMGLQARYSYLDVIQNYHRIDAEIFPSFLETHELGVSVLASPSRLASQDGPSMEQLVDLLGFSRRLFGHVVIDAGQSDLRLLERLLAESAHQVLVATPELPTLRNLKRAMEGAPGLHPNQSDGLRLVLNQFAEGLGVTLKDVEQALGVAVDTVLPRVHDLASESLNLGRPALLASRSVFKRPFQELAREIAGVSGKPAEARGLFKALVRPFRSAASVI
jgi:pilus assembly protein CpaE